MEWWIYLIIAFLVFDLLLVVFIFVKRSRSKALGVKEMQYINSHWIRIIDMFNSNAKEAIIDADKLLHYALDKHGFEGMVGEKLKKAGARFSDLNGVWFAHKLRNKFAHEMGGKLDLDEAKRALKHFKKALNELGAGL